MITILSKSRSNHRVENTAFVSKEYNSRYQNSLSVPLSGLHGNVSGLFEWCQWAGFLRFIAIMHLHPITEKQGLSGFLIPFMLQS